MRVNNRHVVLSGLATVFGIIIAITAFIYAIDIYAPEIAEAALVLLFLGLATGALMPSIIMSWLVILLTTVGVAVLTLGNVPLALHLKLILLAIFPVSAILMAINSAILIRAGWVRFNTRAIERYMRHYDQITKLQKTYNASKMYLKAIGFIRNDVDDALWFDVTALHWVHNAQFRQFHRGGYDDLLRAIAKVLKTDRLPSESLYYLGQGTFLIISHQVPHDEYRRRNDITEKNLNAIPMGESTPQFKCAKLRIDRSNAGTYPTLDDAMRHLERRMETDLVIEYLKADKAGKSQ